MLKNSQPLNALTHFDGRNGPKLEKLRGYFSELAWMEYRARVMVAYLQFLIDKNLLPYDSSRSTSWRTSNNKKILEQGQNVVKIISVKDGERVQEIE